MIAGKIKYKHISNDLRFNSGYFLNEDAVNSRVLEENSDKCSQLHEIAEVWNPLIFKRQFCQKTERAIPYCQSSDVTNALEGSKVFINKIQATKVGSVVEKNQILVTGFGTIGNTRLVNELSDGISYANNVCRIKAHDETKYGYLYAILSSKYGRSQLNKNASGSVVRYIEAPGIKKTLIPILSESKQQEINKLIEEASKLRVDANRLLAEALDKMETKLPKIEFKKIYKAKISSRISHNSRIEATYDTNLIDNFYNELSHKNVPLKTISELSESVFTPGIFKRIRTNNPEAGIPFLSGSDLLNQYPNFQNFLSRKMKNIENYILRNGWLAIQDAGTIGYISYITTFLDGVSATNNLVRVVPKEKENYNYYIYCFIKTTIGQKLLKANEYGSVQKHIDNNQVSNFRIPIFKDIENQISDMVKKSMDNLGKACFLEKEAKDLVEKEIESWQK